MSTITQSWQIAAPIAVPEPDEHNWYALLTRARHEKVVAQRLREIGVTSFLPVVTELRKWSDRKKLVEFPLFSCYVFAKLHPSNEGRLKALRIDGVYSLVGTRGEGTAIPEEQIDAIRRIAEERLAWHSHPFLKIGQRVRIRSGALNGVEGILVARSGESTLVVSVDAIQRSLAVRIDGYAVEPV
ncbi:MAG TPA: UpxY family transcription antiterminator [Candidatus Sulfotelmatobacter sp.]|nr:UpxY family transcription antiterminator [Candidatus Sulfotelmatobacter sp.]